MWLSFSGITLIWMLAGDVGRPSASEVGLLSGALVCSFFVVITSLCLHRRSLLVTSITVLAVLYCCLMFANWWHEQFFGVYFNYEYLKFEGDLGELAYSLKAFPFFSELMGVLLVVSLCIALIGITYSKPKAGLQYSIFGVALTLMFGLLAVHEMAVRDLKRVNMSSLSAKLFHPVHAVVYPSKALYLDGDNGAASESFFRAWSNPSLTPKSLKGVEGLNVIFLVVESLRADQSSFWNDGIAQSAMPNLDRFAAENTSITNFYANTNYTIKAETALWCGVFDHSIKPPYSKYHDQITDLNCLPEVLRKSFGYESLYFHAGHSRFYSRGDYLPKVGFNRLHFYADEHPQEHQEKRIGWGVSDRIVYDFSLAELEAVAESGKPFFASIMSISNHYPFDWAWDEPVDFLSEKEREDDAMMSKYRRSLYYTDIQLGHFIERFEQSDLAKNTILVITGDHGVWVFDDADTLDQIEMDERFFRVPFVMYHPNRPGAKVLDIVGSQIDLPPTIFSLLGYSTPSELVGQDLLAVEGGDGWAVSMKSGKAYVRHADSYCVPLQAECAGVHQNCSSWLSMDITINDGGEYCFTVDGDLFNPGTNKKSKPSQYWTQEAMSMITHQNSKVFSRSVRLLPSGAD